MNMRYPELHIETQRQAPSRARSEGLSMLLRAGYVTRDGEWTPLGRHAYAKIEELSQTKPPAQAFALLKLPVVETRDGEYLFPLRQGAVEAAQCPACGYAARRSVAKVKKPDVSQEAAKPLEKVLTPDCHTIEALAQFLHVPEAQTAKALMYTRTTDNKFVFVVVRGDMQLSEDKLRKHVGDFRLATADEIAKAGATPGFASPIGLKDALVVVDDLIPGSPNLVAGANEAGYHLLNTNYGRDYTAEIVEDLILAEPGSPCPDCGEPLSIINGDLLAGSDGYCFGSVLEALAETHHDEKGLTLPVQAAPFDVYMLHIPGKEMDTRQKAEELHDTWQQSGISVLFDDRDERAGVKFNDADLIGCPVRATIGEKTAKNGMVELKTRTGNASIQISFADAPSTIQSLLQRTP